jgi:hypothetical protein
VARDWIDAALLRSIIAGALKTKAVSLIAVHNRSRRVLRIVVPCSTHSTKNLLIIKWLMGGICPPMNLS